MFDVHSFVTTTSKNIELAALRRDRCRWTQTDFAEICPLIASSQAVPPLVVDYFVGSEPEDIEALAAPRNGVNAALVDGDIRLSLSVVIIAIDLRSRSRGTSD